MDPEQRGLRARLGLQARRISSQHRQLDSLWMDVVGALDRQNETGALHSFERFRDALDAHMSLEDQLHFPALHGLRAGLEQELETLSQEHRSFRADLDALEILFREGSQERERRLDRFIDLFAAHERREERLLAGIGRVPEPEP